MDDNKWERWGLLGGIGAVVLILVGAFVPGAPPDSDASAADIAEYYVDNDSAIQFSTLMIALAVILIVWWFGSVWRHLRRAEGGEARLSIIATIGLVLSGAAAMVASALNSTVAIRIEDIGGGARIFYTLQQALFGMSTTGDVILIAAVSALAIRTKFLPDWLAYGGAGIAVIQLVGTLTVATSNSGVALLNFIAFLTWLLWIAAVSVVLYQKPPEVAAAA